MKQPLCFGLLLVLCTTVFSLPSSKWDENSDFATRLKAMEVGCYSMNLTHVDPDSKQALTDERTRWTDKTVPYIWDRDSKWTARQRAEVEKGMRMISDVTCIRFTPRTNQRNWIIIRSNREGCYAYLGMNRRSGGQIVNLSTRGCITAGTAAHEFIHALGMDHEHNRTDRDDYINIHKENMADGTEFAFEINRATTTFGLPYDLDSIMHYWSTAFSKNGKPTITSKIPGKKVPDTDTNDLSPNDIEKLKRMYKC